MSVVETHPSALQCRYCTETLARGQQKCTKCGCFQDDACLSCGTPLPPNAIRCSACKKVQKGPPCRTCGVLLEPGTKRCADCGMWQTRRRFLPESQVTLALILSIISVLSAVIPPVVRYFQNRSRTYVRVLGDYEYKAKEGDVPDATIRVLVMNNGKRPSRVKSGVITFENIKAKPAELVVKNLDNTVVQPDKHEYICFTTESVGRQDGVTKKQILASLASGTAHIAVRVEETGIGGAFYDADPMPEHFINGSEIKLWMEAHVNKD